MTTDARASSADESTPGAAVVATLIPALVALLIYLPALRNGFALDDITIVRDNFRIHSLSTLPQALSLPYWYEEGHLYRPLTTLSFAIEWAVGGGSPLVFHALNILWHTVVTILLVRLALRWWPPLAAGAAGLFFALHPVHAETVANIVGRSELVCAAAHDPPIGGIRSQDASVEIGHGHADGGVFEGGLKPLVRFPECLRSLAPGADVVEVGHQSSHVGVVAVVADRGFGPRHRGCP